MNGNGAEGPTFSEFVDRYYLPHFKADAKPMTFTNRRYQLDRLKAAFGAFALDGIPPLEIERYRLGRASMGISARTINDDRKAFNAIFSYAPRVGVAVVAPPWLKMRERGVRGPSAPSPAQVAKLFEEFARLDPGLLVMTMLIANTGMRKGEARMLRRDDFVFSDVLPYVWIRATEDGSWTPKGEDARQVSLPTVLVPALRAWLSSHASAWAFPCPKTGKPWAYYPQKRFQRVARAAGLDGGPHQLRHAKATCAALEGVPREAIQKMLGHKDARTTANYIHVPPNHLALSHDRATFAPPRLSVEPGDLPAA